MCENQRNLNALYVLGPISLVLTYMYTLIADINILRQALGLYCVPWQQSAVVNSNTDTTRALQRRHIYHVPHHESMTSEIHTE